MLRHVFLVVTSLAVLAACGPSSSGADAGTDVRFINVRVEEIAARRAVVRFTTSRPTTCEVHFGLTPDALTRTATDPDMAEGRLETEHEVPLEDLTPVTTFHFRPVATDGEGRQFQGDPGSFTTLAESGTTEVNAALLSRGANVAEVSSNYGGGDNTSGWGANKALDGEMATEWASNGDGDGAYLVVDLGADALVSAVGFRSRKMADGTSIIRSIRVRLDDSAPLGPFDTPDPDTTYRFPLDSPTTARRVRFEAVTTSGGNTGAKEVQVFTPGP
ncbi:MAG: discoidin domain-containing protein [Myxococcota bacterium]